MTQAAAEEICYEDAGVRGVLPLGFKQKRKEQKVWMKYPGLKGSRNVRLNLKYGYLGE